MRELVVYFGLACGISVALWLPVLMGREVSHWYLSAGTFGPPLAALATHRISGIFWWERQGVARRC